MGPIAAVLILLTPLSGHAVLLTGTVLTALVGVKLVVMKKAEKAAGSVPSLGRPTNRQVSFL